jgi:hypothetical protein
LLWLFGVFCASIRILALSFSSFGKNAIGI